MAMSTTGSRMTGIAIALAMAGAPAAEADAQPGAPAQPQAVQTGTAQASGRVAGVALSSDGERLVGAEVRLVGSPSRGALTGHDGAFDLAVRGDTLPRFVIRRIGFVPETVTVRLPQAAAPALEVRLARAFQMVRPVVVTASNVGPNTTIALVRERERTAGTGYFVFRDEFMKNNPVQTTDILRRIPGVQLIRTPGNTNTVRLRENRCTPLFWIDGIALVGIPFDPNTQPPSTIEAIEVYSSPSLVPVQFRGPMGSDGCGSVVIWTRQGEYRVRVPRISADSIVRLLDAHRIFVSTEVDVPARVRTLPEPEYPDSLRAAGVSGSAVIEFIIEADGHVNVESIGVVSTTHQRFADAVRVAILEAGFSAALKANRPVAQVYQLPVTFTAPKRP